MSFDDHESPDSELATRYIAAAQNDYRRREDALNIQLRRAPASAEATAETPVATGAQDLLARLRADIVKNTFEPEAKLKFAELTRRYEFGIGTLREALSQLVSEGLVILEAGKGFRVAPVSRADLREVTEHYLDFEKRALAGAIERGNDDWEGQIVASFHRLGLIEDLTWKERMRRHGDWVERHREFHQALVAACEGQWLLRLRSLMFNQLERYRFLSKLSRENSLQSKGVQHRAIMQATLARNAKKATHALEQHVRETFDAALRSLA